MIERIELAEKEILKVEGKLIEDEGKGKGKMDKSILESKIVMSIKDFDEKNEGGFRGWAKGFKNKLQNAQPGLREVIECG